MRRHTAIFLPGRDSMIDAKVLPDLTEGQLAIVSIERAETVPSGWYTQPLFHDADNEVVHARTWQYAGHTSQIKREGDYLLTTAAGNPILIIRGKDGALRAFFNVCRHRGGPL